MNPHASDDGLLYDFCDGESFKAHPLFSTDKFALQLLLYYDELEVCNPLGSRANKHKLGAFYYALGNIRPEKRSSVNAIQLLALATSKHIKQYGIEPVLECFLQDLSELEKDAGHKFSINGALVTFRGTIGYFSGDNLGSQLIGGFKEGSRSHRPCRECMATGTEITAHFHESKFILRTQNSYDVQCQRLAQGGHFGKTYGLNKQSCLTQSRYFHVIGGLPPDAMHDILEGVLQYCVKLALKVFVLEKKFLTIEELNRRILTFDYGYQNDTNKPSANLRTKLASDEKSLKQHANQIWCLATHLPLLIGTLVPEDDEHWELMCCLLEIVRIIFSPQISKDQMPYLQFKIQYHQEKFKVLYPDWSIIPKMHYMVHMPRVILQNGPLVRSWCMRYESKHHYFKHLSVMIGNYINLPFSLAKRHQEGLCCRIQASGGSLTSLIEKGIVVGPGSTSHVGTVDQSEVLLGEDPEMDHLTPVFQVKWVTICGTKYKVGAVLHIGYDNNNFPKFWEIMQIYVVDRNITNVKFIVAEKLTLEFNVHFQSYEVTSLPIQHIKVVYHRDFTYFRPLNLTKPIGLRTRTKYVCMRVELGTCM